MSDRDVAAQLLEVAAHLQRLAEALSGGVAPRTGPVVDARVALEVGHHEAICRSAYLDAPLPKGTWTWSVGLTGATGHHVERYIDRPATLQQCIDVYVWALKRYSQGVLDVFTGHELSQAAFAGALSFHWNTGAIGSSKCHWPRLYMDGKMAEAEAGFRSFNRSGGKLNEVLVKRRKAEADLIWRGIWASDGTMTEYRVSSKTHFPVWSSASILDVRPEITRALSAELRPEIDGDPQPNAEPTVPTLSTARLDPA
jgi:GH24 family phage-related lysozyme (muramidase)